MTDVREHETIALPHWLTRMLGGTVTKATGTLSPVDSNRGGWLRLLESYTGAWQSNVEVNLTDVTTYSSVFACTTLIASDISKCRPRFVQQDSNDIWNEIESPAFSPVLRKPNHFQNRITFYATWVISKLLHGNTYVLKQRDDRRVVTAMYILDPTRVTPLVAPDSSVYYDLQRDDLSQVSEAMIEMMGGRFVVPASEIIHDLHNPLFHPLVGLSAIYACGLAAVQGLRIQDNSAVFFGNGSRPGGVLTAPGAINDTTAARLKAYWDANFTGANAGKVAVLGDGLKYEQMTMSALDAQLIEQLKWTAENVCSAFHVPAYMVGVGAAPNYNNIEALNQQYYSQCLQALFEAIELCLDEGLGLTTGENATKRYGVEFDLDDLLRMDSNTLMKTIGEGVKAGVVAPNEGRKRINSKPVAGGDTPYLQQQNFSLAALAKRDAQADPFAVGTATPAPRAEEPDDDELEDDDAEKQLTDLFRKELVLARAA